MLIYVAVVLRATGSTPAIGSPACSAFCSPFRSTNSKEMPRARALKSLEPALCLMPFSADRPLLHRAVFRHTQNWWAAVRFTAEKNAHATPMQWSKEVTPGRINPVPARLMTMAPKINWKNHLRLHKMGSILLLFSDLRFRLVNAPFFFLLISALLNSIPLLMAEYNQSIDLDLENGIQRQGNESKIWSELIKLLIMSDVKPASKVCTGRTCARSALAFVRAVTRCMHQVTRPANRSIPISILEKQTFWDISPHDISLEQISLIVSSSSLA